MRQAINNLQSTAQGFGFVNSENVFKVCDQPHPFLVKEIIAACLRGGEQVDKAMDGMRELYGHGYSAADIVGTLFKVVKGYEGPDMSEYIKLEYIKVKQRKKKGSVV